MNKNDLDEKVKRIVELAERMNDETKSLSPKAIYDQIDNLIIGNNNYKKSISIALADFLKKDFERNHLLVVGPSGSGKTHLLEKALPPLNIPFYIIDCANLVPSGYKGKSLNETIEFFLSGVPRNSKNIIILDEFDKISSFANGGDDFKSQSIQSELLILLSGAAEGKTNTKNTLWILAGAFAYADEAKNSYREFNTNSILKYGFKNELVGRISKVVKTEIPSIEEVIKRVLTSPLVTGMLEDMERQGYKLTIQDEAFLEMAEFCQNPSFGMRGLAKIVYQMKEHVLFESKPGEVEITKTDLQKLIAGM